MGGRQKVAVIGAGVAGLIAARELHRGGHRVVVFEKADRLGGMWVYDPRVEQDELGLDPNRQIVHCSLYNSLRTNIPRQIMGFSDYPFGIQEYGDRRNFPGHQEVLRFLNNFAEEFGIVELIRFGNEVVRVERADSGGGEWVVESRTSEANSVVELFEAVVVCSGHSTVPRVANFPGIDKWPGKQVHSHNYRHPEPYQNQVVVMIGNGPSAYDISREIATVAKEVHLSSRSPNVKVSKFDNHNIWQHSKITNVCEDGKVEFEDGSSVLADTIFYCTGYEYSFPFLKTNGIVSIEDKRVGPLYKHVFPPSLALSLSFVGITERSVIFAVAELQSKWISGVLSGKLHLPSEEEMLAEIKQHYQYMEDSGIPKHLTHYLDFSEFGYQNWVAAQVGLPAVDERVKELFRQLLMYFVSQKDGFRDELDPENILLQST